MAQGGSCGDSPARLLFYQYLHVLVGWLTEPRGRGGWGAGFEPLNPFGPSGDTAHRSPSWSWRPASRAFFWGLSRPPSRGRQRADLGRAEPADFWPPLEMADAQRRGLRGHRRRLACCGRSTTEDSRWGEQPRRSGARGARAAFRGERRMEVGLRSTYKKTNSLAPGAGWAPGLVSGLFAGRWAVLGALKPLTPSAGAGG